ncbi:peptidase C14, caspase domain-containing protein [Zopfochytrium polystomum]|nr:peptidase C14, caspase domain-containing protein [Zopfochytrium polystomum]
MSAPPAPPKATGGGKGSGGPGAPARAPVRRALLIGINYIGQKVELKGCINDVKNVRKMLVTRLGYDDSPDAMLVLTDDAPESDKQPTKANILRALAWLRRDARPGDVFYVHFSGHGSQQNSTGKCVFECVGCEECAKHVSDSYESLDETLVPVDYLKAGQIVDNDLNKLLVYGLPAGCRMTCVFDCCHSGTILDLPYEYDKDGKLKRSIEFDGKRITESHQFKDRTTDADVVLLSGCLDSQTSADANIDGRSTGALTYAIMAVVKNSEGRHVSFLDMLLQIRNILKDKKYKQVPQLSTGRPIDFSKAFFL